MEKPINLCNLHVVNDSIGKPHLCKFRAIDPNDETYIYDIQDLDDKSAINTIYIDFFSNQYIAFSSELVKNVSNHSFKTLLEKYNISQEFDINDIDASESKFDNEIITLLWEYLRHAIMLERYNNEIAEIEMKRQEEMEHERILLKKKNVFLKKRK